MLDMPKNKNLKLLNLIQAAKLSRWAVQFKVPFIAKDLNV